MPDENSEKLNKLEKIYHIIEFEIENANNQINLSKKDNINFILLFFALIGLFVFIPTDTFFYKWFGNGIWIIVLLIGANLILSILIYYFFFKKGFKEGNSSNDGNNQKCELCESKMICKNMDVSIKKEYFKKYLNSVFIENIDLYYMTFINTSFIFLLSCMIPYFYFTSSNDATPSFQNNSWISLLLMLLFISYIILYFKQRSLLKERNFKKYLSKMAIYSAVIFILAVTIIIYGIYSKIPPFIEITNDSQFSSLLIEHLKIIPSMPLSWIVSFYVIFIGVVLIEYFISSKYIKIITQKLEELLSLKYRIDRYQLEISSEFNIENIITKLSKLKIQPPSYITTGGIFTIPIPLLNIKCEEMVYLAIEDQLIEEKEEAIQN